MRSKRVNELHGIILVVFGMLTIISTGNSISVCDTLQPNSIGKETMDDRQLLLVEDSDNNDWLDELSVSDDYYSIFNSGSIYTRRKRGFGAVLGAVATGIGAVTNLLSIKKSIGGQEKPKQQENTALIETNAKLNNIQNTIQNNLEDIKDMNAQLRRNQEYQAIYVTGMDAKLRSIQNSLGTITLINGRLDKIENSQESNKKAMTGQLQNVQKNLESIKEMNKNLNSNQKSLDDYVRGIVSSKIDNIQKSLGDYMKEINGKLNIIQKAQEENRKAIDMQLGSIQNGVKDLKDRIQVHFKDIYDSMKQNLESVKHDLQEAFEVQEKKLALNQLKTEFSKYERIIEDSLKYSILCRKTNSTTSKASFLKAGSQLESAIDAILDGLLGGGIFGSDILEAIRIGKNNHGNNFIRAYEDIRDLLGAAAGVLAIYYRTSKADQAHIELWIEQMGEKESRVTNRVRGMELDCRTEGQNVVEDIKKIITTYANETSNVVGERVYHHLSDKYSTSLWYVIANYPWMEKEKPFHSKNNYNRRFEVFDFKGKNVVAYSFDHNDLAMSNFDGCMNKLAYLYWHIHVQNPPTFNEWRNDRPSNRAEQCGNAKEIHDNFRNIDGNTDFIIEVISHENPFNNAQNWRNPRNCDFWKRVYCFSRSSSKAYYYDIYIFPGGKSTRKYFKIVSQLNGMIVEASTLSSKLPGGHVHMKPDSNVAHQFWFLELKSQTIRSMQTDLCLTSNGSDQVYLNWCDISPSDQQLWRLKKDDTIVSWANPTQCLQVQEYSNADTLRLLTIRNCTGALNQKFTIKY